jgi:hypothetical protein
VVLSEYELRVLQAFEDDFATDRTRAAARLRWGALALVLIAAVLAGCLIGALVSALAGVAIGSLGVAGTGVAAWFLRRRQHAAK